MLLHVTYIDRCALIVNRGHRREQYRLRREKETTEERETPCWIHPSHAYSNYSTIIHKYSNITVIFQLQLTN